jgi:hypothetical protein
MRYWKVSLLREGRTAREWHVHAEALSIGSNGANRVRLPPPVEPFALRLETISGPEMHEIGPYLLRVEDETDERGRLWIEAQERIELAREVFVEMPCETQATSRLALAACALVGLTNFTASILVDGRTQASREFQHSHVAVGRMQVPHPGYAPSGANRAILQLVAPSTSDAHLSAVGPSVPLEPGAQTSSELSVALASLDLSGLAAGDIWSSSPPSRYRAPWPDAPVPPH